MLKKLLPFLPVHFLLICLIFLSGNNADSVYQDYIGKKIIRIDFTGNKFKSASDLLDLIYARPGLILSKDIINEDIKKLYASGAFSDVRLIAQKYKRGVALEFLLEERSYIQEIEFRGLDAIIEKEAKEAILLEEEGIYDEKLISESIEILKLKHEEEGLFNAAIKTKVEVLEGDQGIKLIFLIDEGEEIEIIRIKVLGTESLDPDDIIDSMELEEDGLISDGDFQKKVFEEDKGRIVSFMRNEGYLDSELVEASWRIVWKDKLKEERGIEITIKVQEGKQYFFNGYDLEWNKEYLNKRTQKPLYTESQLYKLFEYTDFDVGDAYNEGKVQNDSALINQLYSQQGYIFTRVQPKRTNIILNQKELKKWKTSEEQVRKEKEGIDYYGLKKLERILQNNPKAEGRQYVHTKFVIYEGNQGYIENIIIKGNEKTQTRVIRREILVQEGQLFHAALVQRSRERIFNLGFFKEVNLDVRPGSSEDKLNLVISIEEQPTGNISLGGGYGTQAGFTIFTELAENNLNGTGQRISGKVDIGPNRILIQTSWREPWLFNKPWSLSLSLFYDNNTIISNNSLADGIQDRTASYESDRFIFSTEVGHQFAIYWRHYHAWAPGARLTHSPSSLVPDNIYAQVNQGWRFSNKVINGITFDSRDNVFNTTSGMRGDFRWVTAGSVLGGSDHFMQFEPGYQFYWWPFDFTLFGLFRKSILRRWRIVFEHRFSMGFTQITAPIYNDQFRPESFYIQFGDLYFLGGYESLRGWLPASPQYPIAWQDRSSHRMLFGSELRIPIEPSIIWFVLFFEAGALFEDINNALLDNPAASPRVIASVRDSGLTASNFRGDYFRYSWGFGFRVQIPILPIRFYLARRVMWDNDLGFFRELPNESFQIVFGIGDQRF